MIEEWRKLAGYGDRYEVSSEGRLRKIDGDPVKSRLDADGYCMADLWDHERYRTVKIHRIVLQTFVGPPEPGQVADHIDRVRSNNSLQNLRWVSKSENNRNKTPYSASGVRGVRFRAGRPKPWQAYHHTDRFVNIGHFVEFSDAVAARSVYV